MSIQFLLSQLIAYAKSHHLLNPDDYEYAVNQLLFLFKLDSFVETPIDEPIDFYVLLNELIDYALNKGLIEDNIEALRDNFEAKMMDSFLPRPSELNRQFYDIYKQAPKKATDFFYDLSKATNYIKTQRIANNITYRYQGHYADLDITINLSKPEKDPKTIALLKHSTSENYPACALCMENVGFYGTVEKAPRSNHRVISLSLNHEKNAWGFQYSPYAYYNEHCIILKKIHEPMRVDTTTFRELIDFINKFPHYLIGSNAGLPIVGGSILSHYHFQGGRYDFPIESARVLHTIKKRGVRLEILDWPLSVIRVCGKNEFDVLDWVDTLFNAWQHYTNQDLNILAKTDEFHNTITPIVKLVNNEYQFYIVLRNNIVTKERPYGLFHPRDAYFHIKKENIGLIEVMGLAVLPGRLKTELDLIKMVLLKTTDIESHESLEKHRPWIEQIQEKYIDFSDVDQLLRDEVGLVFEKVLEDCGVFKSQDLDEFVRFLEKSAI